MLCKISFLHPLPYLTFSANITYSKIGEELTDFSAINIPPDAEHVDLSFNKFTNIPSTVFINHPNLKHLDLFSCKIQTIQNNAFSSLKSLILLHIHSNRIQVVTHHMLKGLFKLEELSLHDNLIEIIEIGSFSDLPALKRLYMSNNKVKTLLEGIFDLVKHRIDLTFEISGNELECDCRFLWILDAQKDWLTITTEPSVNCTGPDTLKGTRLQDLDEQSLTSTYCPLFGR